MWLARMHVAMGRTTIPLILGTLTWGSKAKSWISKVQGNMDTNRKHGVDGVCSGVWPDKPIGHAQPTTVSQIKLRTRRRSARSVSSIVLQIP